MKELILITGGSGKVGLILTSHFLGSGFKVIATCNSEQSHKMLLEEFKSYPDDFFSMQIDLMSEDAKENLICHLEEKNLQPDYLINNARSMASLRVSDDGLTDRENFINEYLLDVIVPYELSMVLAMQHESRLKKIINIGSQYGLVPFNPNLYSGESKTPIQYSVAKAALIHLTKELAIRLAKNNIQVNCVAYGGIEGRVDAQFMERYSRLTPNGRMLNAEDIAGPIDLLLAKGCSAITGHTLAVDGGWSIW